MAYAKFEFERAFSTGKEGFDPEREDWLNKIETARGEGHKAGLQAGHTQALGEIQAQTATLVGQLQTEASLLLTDRVALENKLRAEAITLAYLISSKLAPALISTYPMSEIENLICDCLLAGHVEPKIIIQVSERMLGPIGEQIEILRADNGYSGKISLVKNSSFGDQDCAVSWPNGGAKRDLTALSLEIKARIETFLGIEVELPEEEVPPPDASQEAADEQAVEADPAEEKDNIEDDSTDEEALTIDHEIESDADSEPEAETDTDTDTPHGDEKDN
jgi:flagellar assembly protein FliH